jgi:hypothetical protein
MIGGCVLLFFFIAIPIGLKINDKQKHFYSFFEGESLSDRRDRQIPRNSYW